jgi:hypothetical protein
MRTGSNYLFPYNRMLSYWYQWASIFHFFTLAPDYLSRMKTLLKGYKFQSAEAMKNTSAGIEGHCYKKPTRILPAMV